MHLSRRELMGVASLNFSDDGISRLHALTFGLANEVSADDALSHGHRSRGRVQRSEVKVTRLQQLGERKQPAALNDQLRDRIVLRGEFGKVDGFASLQAFEHGVVSHQLAEIDVVALVDGGEGSGDDDADAGPSLALCRGFSAGTRAFALTGDDDFEVSVLEGVLPKHAQAVVHQAGIGVLGDFSGVVVKTDPCRRHDVRVDVVKQIIDGEVLHSQVQTFVELLLDEAQIFGEEKDPFPGGERNLSGRFFVSHAPPSNLFKCHPFITGSGV